MDYLNTIIWDTSPEIFHFGIISIRWYGLLFAFSFIAGYQILTYIFNKENKPIQALDQLAIYVAIGTAVGARLGHCLFYAPQYYLSNPLEILKIWEGGLASHGGAIGILIAIWIFSQKNKAFRPLWILDRLVIVVALAGLFIRTGNFFNSEICGTPTDVPWAITFALRDNLPRHPAQLYEALAYLSIFIILFWTYKKNNFKEGFLFGLFLVLVFCARFMLEFFKEIQSGFEADLLINMGQILSIPFIIVGIVFIIRASKKK